MSVAMLARKRETAPAPRAKAPSKPASSSLRIREANDSFEREADRAASEVMAGSRVKREWSLSGISMGTPLQRKCACGGGSSERECKECQEKGRLQRRSDTSATVSAVPSEVHQVLRSPGRPLDAATRSFFEPRFGYDFSRVRVHTEARAAQSADSVHAVAYTVGRDIVFGEGNYAPTSGRGQELLAHELSHVIQQEGGSPPVESPALRLGAPRDSYELDASRVAGMVLHRGPGPHSNPKQKTGARGETASAHRPWVGIQRSPSFYVARQCLNPDICAKNKTKASCLQVSCGWNKTGVCGWPSIAVGCCCLGAKERPKVQEQESTAGEPAKKTSREDAARKLRELLPVWVVALIGVALLALLVACFATGVCEAGIILGGATVAVAAIIIAVLRHAGVEVRGGIGPGQVPTA
jgi:hypothetical protein